MDRPAIPAEMKRIVLVEAGHRCAIPHCSQTPVDVHHIISWEKCGEHSPDNLIALCPNCHRRAHSGEIDRKALMHYKLRGKRILSGIYEGPVSIEQWKTVDYRENQRQYDVEISYPEFDAREYRWAEEVNARIKGAIFAEIEYIRNIANEAPWSLSQRSEEGRSTLLASFEIFFFLGNILSIRFSIYTYFIGAAHGQGWARSFNLYLDPVCKISLKHFFPNAPGTFDSASRLVRQQFEALNFSKDTMWIEEGTKSEEQNFKNFNITENGLLFTFDEYQVGPYAAGRQQVIVPFLDLGHQDLPNEIAQES
jgi:hypothetical protein